QGLSFKQVLASPDEQMPRKSLYYHFYEFHADHSVLEHIGVRTDRYKLMYFYTVNEWQLFDLQKDPEELHNLVKDPGYRQVLADMKTELNRQKAAYADPIPEGKLE
ncbi:MAG TPA: sulfatase/phosphatase domain-containing protein, partial [Sediminibacterium sp.]|nr:sulfatase/phosphatase domain-containing protein [Sediminibacterium sp.]